MKTRSTTISEFNTNTEISEEPAQPVRLDALTFIQHAWEEFREELLANVPELSSVTLGLCWDPRFTTTGPSLRMRVSSTVAERNAGLSERIKLAQLLLSGAGNVVEELERTLPALVKYEDDLAKQIRIRAQGQPATGASETST